MNKAILNTVIQDFINSNIESDTASLLLKITTLKNVNLKEIVEQIDAKKRCKNKLPTWFRTLNIYYPNKLNIEQTSSELSAKYKSSIIQGDTLIDLTGGFGVDCFYFSKSFKEVTHCEIDKKLSEIATHNYTKLGTNNIKTICNDGIDYLNSSKQNYDWIYADPSRRHESKGKVFYLKDCLPNIPEHLEILFEHSNNILIKASPMLDISVGVSELKFTKSIHIIAINNEVKELLFVLSKNFDGEIEIKTLNINNNGEETFNFNYNNETNASSKLSTPLAYLYEPNAAILKSGAFKTLSQRLDVFKLHQHTHLYTSHELISFPGRSFKIEKVIPYNKKAIKKEIGSKQVNVSIRNFPESVAQLKKKFNIRDGGETYVFFTTNADNEKIAITCKKA